MCTLISLCPQLITLHTLRVSECVATTATTYPSQCKKSRLRTVVLFCHTASTLSFLAQNCPYLHTLYIRECEQPLPSALTHQPHITASLFCLQQTKLRALYMRGYNRLSDDHLSQLHNLSLEVLSINKSRTITDKSVLTLLSTLSHVHTVKLVRCTELTDRLKLLAPKVCSTLRTFWLKRATGAAQERSKVEEALVRKMYPHIQDCQIVF